MNIFYWVLNIVGLFFMFEENGVQGWKSVIPFYGTYVQYKLFYKKSMYFVFLVFEIILFVALFGLFFLGFLVQGVPSSQITDSQGISFIVMILVLFVSTIAILVIDIMFKVSLAKKYEKGGLFIFGLILVEPIMLAYLAWENRDKLKK